MSTRIAHATVITPRDDGVVILPDHTVEFEGGQITFLGPTAGSSKIQKSDFPADPSLDGSRLLVIPGLVNTHHHLFQSLTRCHPAVQNAKLFDWLVRQYPIWRRMDYESLKLAATIS